MITFLGKVSSFFRGMILFRGKLSYRCKLAAVSGFYRRHPVIHVFLGLKWLGRPAGQREEAEACWAWEVNAAPQRAKGCA